MNFELGFERVWRLARSAVIVIDMYVRSAKGIQPNSNSFT